jgi:GDPmannose 4,6-dehydratase
MGALITGITGQDGYYLARLLHQLGTDAWGTTRSATPPQDLDFARIVQIADYADQQRLERVIVEANPDEIYHLAAQSSVAASWEDPVATADITGLGTLRLLEAVRNVAPAARVFVASSSEIFGEPAHAPQDEQTAICPTSPYGAAKAFSHHVATMYRQRYGLFIAIGILYNHESPRRPPSFVTQKIVQGAVAIARGQQTELHLGNLDARRDWGFAGDYVRAMRLMLQQPEPGDYVVATGETHAVRDWCELAFSLVGLDYRTYVVSDQQFWRPAEAIPLMGNGNKARAALHWVPTTSFQELVTTMVEAEIDPNDQRSAFNSSAGAPLPSPTRCDWPG